MTTPKDVRDLFSEAQAAFAPVVGATNDDDVKRLNKVLVNALQSIDVPGGKVDFSNILLSDNDHKAKHAGRTFDRMETPLKSYDDGITGNATNAIRANRKYSVISTYSDYCVIVSHKHETII